MNSDKISMMQVILCEHNDKINNNKDDVDSNMEGFISTRCLMLLTYSFKTIVCLNFLPFRRCL